MSYAEFEKYYKNPENGVKMVENNLRKIRAELELKGFSKPVNPPKESQKSNENFLEFFLIKSSKTPIYTLIKSIQDIKKYSKQILKNIENMSEKITYIIDVDNNKFKYNHTKESLQSMLKSIDRFKNIFQDRIDKAKFDDNEISDLQESFYNFLTKQLSENFISSIIQSIYEGFPKDFEVYESIIKTVNNFLSELGVKTMELKPDTVIDYDIIEVIDSSDNFIDVKSKKNKIKEIRMYPYLFDEEHFVIKGEIIEWRVKYE